MGYKVQSTRLLSSSRLNIKNLRVLPLYLVSPNTTSITEGNTVTFTISAFNVDNGTTLYWNNSGTAIAADFTGAVNSGSFTVTNQTATVTLTLVSADLPEGIETIIFEVRTGSTSGAILVTAATVSIFDAAATFAISPSTSSVTEGNSVTYTVTTTNVANGTLYWTNSGTTVAADFSDASNSGSFTLTNGSGTITRTLANNAAFEGTETIILEVRTGSTSGTIVATSSTVNVTDAAATYSVSPSTSSVNEGSSVTWTVTTTNVADSTTLYWTNSGTTVAGDFTGGANSGSFTITSNSGSFSLTLSNDLTTEGSETIIIQIRTGSTSGTIVATASTVTVNDTSFPTNPTSVEYLIVAGGGSGGNGSSSSWESGGGGGGGYRTGTVNNLATNTLYTVTVGGGGANSNGSNSVFNGITSTGGGKGATAPSAGSSGGSGGGGAGGVGGGTGGGAGNNPSTTPSQGNNGGPGAVSAAGGGGGAGANGGAASPCNGGSGGNGLQNSISGSSTYYAGGGGGGVTNSPGGLGGGANGSNTSTGKAGTANTGGGGGGAASSAGAIGGNGGSGIVILRYADTFAAATAVTGGPTYTVTGGYRIYRWTGNGSITW